MVGGMCVLYTVHHYGWLFLRFRLVGCRLLLHLYLPLCSTNKPIEAKKGNPPMMPVVITPGGPLDLSSVLVRNRIIFIGQPINSQVAQRVYRLVYLNCPDGSTYSVLAISDCMSWVMLRMSDISS
ncbi:ATP-dependent Clp protease proteolytic subunit 6, chloroplastic-like [Silene latifolia]|uniref:ATP-dependent Clp protease proteolytic subunit 6, chloroplastic-like n=1 Tax=Silene latifolia TaxID=37657 RepID=UPI003D7813D7